MKDQILKKLKDDVKNAKSNHAYHKAWLEDVEKTLTKAVQLLEDYQAK